MKTIRPFSTGLKVATALLCLGLLPIARAENSSANASSAAGKTNSAPEELPIPLSVFDLTIKPTKDPFFPLSVRQPITQATNAAPAFSASYFTLKGLSGSAGHRLALVNNRTLAEGEETEITTPGGKVKIHCVEIKDSSVVLRVAKQEEPLEISLRKAVQ